MSLVPSSRNFAVSYTHLDVYKRQDLLHASLDTVIVEVRPRKARSRAPARDAGAELRTHYAAAHNRTKVLVIGNPVGLHILNLVGVRQHHLVEHLSLIHI